VAAGSTGRPTPSQYPAYVLKTDEHTGPLFEKLGSEALHVRSGNVLTSYYELPADVLDDEQEFVSWARQAIDVATRQPERSRKRKHVDPEQMLQGHAPEIIELAQQARALIRKAAPEASEAGYSGWHLIGYRSPHYFCFAAPHADHRRLHAPFPTLAHGTRIARERHVKRRGEATHRLTAVAEFSRPINCQRSSLPAQGDHRIYSRRPARGQIDRERRHHEQS